MQLPMVEIDCRVSVNTWTFIKCDFGVLRYVDYLQKKTVLLEKGSIIHLSYFRTLGCVRNKMGINSFYPGISALLSVLSEE